MVPKSTKGRLLLPFGLLALAPLLVGFLCFPLGAPPPSAGPAPVPVATFAPTVSANVSNSTPNAAADVHASLSFPAGSTLAIVAFFDIPAGWLVAADGAVTNGAVVGSITGFMTVDNPTPDIIPGSFGCNTDVDFDPTEGSQIVLVEATTATSPTVPGTDTDIPADGKPEVVEIDALTGLPKGAVLYPAFLNTILPGTHKARYFGHTEAGGLSDLYVNVIVAELAPGGPYRVITIVNDPTSPPESAASLFCAPMSLTMTFLGTSADNPSTAGTNEAGQNVYRNPAMSGSYAFSAALVSEFDHDNDGVSNGLDNCPFAADGSQSDSDQDFVGNACDGSSAQNFDIDADGINNGYDNCLATSNAAQADADYDDLGDACDPDVMVPNGPNYRLVCTDPVGIGRSDPGGATCVPGSDPNCADPDGDGLNDCSEQQLGTDPNDPDTDKDGCSDGQEMGQNPSAGGRRNPLSIWDVFDTSTANGLGAGSALMGAVSLSDILDVAGHFGQLGNPATNVLSNAAGPGYHTRFDRGGAAPGGDRWDLIAPDGAIALSDVLDAAVQFGLVC